MNEGDLARRLHQAGRLADAEAAYRAALQRAPEDGALLRDLGVLLMQSRRLSDALVQFARIPLQHPAHPSSLVPRALCERDSGLPGDALASAGVAIAATPGDPLGWLLHGSLLVATGAIETAEASLRRCLHLAPGMAEAHHFLGECLQRQGRYREAIAEYQHVLRSKPQEALNIAQCAESLGDMALARRYYEHAVQAIPAHLHAHARLLHVLSLTCDFPARDALRRKLGLLLEQPLADGDRPEPFHLCYQQLAPATYRKALAHYAAQHRARIRPTNSALRRSGERIHIGYLSADFGNHAVGHLIQGLLRAHDRDGFRISAFSLATAPQAATPIVEHGIEAFFPLGGLSDTEAAALIAAQDVDVLFDLGGYTKGSRPSILALRPAGIQLGWLGFISPHEAPWLDALVFDDVVQPEDEDWLFSDHVVRLPSPLLPGTGPATIAPATRADFGLPEVGPVLASFNNTYKLSADLISAWAAILSACPDTHLAIYAPDHAREGLTTHWQVCGGDGSRLIFLDNIDRASNLARMRCCDLMLDAFDYSAGATAIDALAAGLPVLCSTGTSPVSRLSASINRFLELPDFIADSPADYIEKAIAIINRKDGLAQARQALLASPKRDELLDPRRTAREIEALCRGLLREEATP
ncbi:tetratricopeptide repeat protein [Stenotrophomonas sp. MYb238]|uniref:O-linked N-acetylglucosamine transferase, SPINDLY family protein n=1 Tax=Stenotrophomonas sp. MYb238 TaxID=2040281 RepID=UPI00129099B0|nr:glycosyltransferase family 41 protein [Stenotrophomonas sp. MYb238]MQP75663.1 tetratricopeptide repeat protein [Stenotrophomonas sp. MYb238]